MTAKVIANPPNRIGPRELRRLSQVERDAILLSAANNAESEYRGNAELTAFEAFGKEDLHAESANSQSR